MRFPRCPLAKENGKRERRKGGGKERGEGKKGMREEEGKEVKREGRVNGVMEKVDVQLPSMNRKKGFRLLSSMWIYLA